MILIKNSATETERILGKAGRPSRASASSMSREACSASHQPQASLTLAANKSMRGRLPCGRSNASFKRLQEADEIADLSGIQSKLRHSWVTRRQPFAECVFQRFDRISLMKSSKWRRCDARASTSSVDRMTPRAIRLRKGFSALDALCIGKCGNARSDARNNKY